MPSESSRPLGDAPTVTLVPGQTRTSPPRARRSVAAPAPAETVEPASTRVPPPVSTTEPRTAASAAKTSPTGACAYPPPAPARHTPARAISLFREEQQNGATARQLSDAQRKASTRSLQRRGRGTEDLQRRGRGGRSGVHSGGPAALSARIVMDADRGAALKWESSALSASSGGLCFTVRREIRTAR